MLKVNKKVEYALMALKHMSSKNDGELTTARELCEKFNLPFDPVSKVMQALNSSGIVSSIKGAKGGYQIAKDLGEITYMEFNTIIEGKSSSHHCGENEDCCERKENCIIKGSIDMLSSELNDYLQKITLKDLLNKKDSVGV